MATIEIFVSSSVRPTERVDRVVSAIENIFPGLVMDIRCDRIEAYGGAESLETGLNPVYVGVLVAFTLVCLAAGLFFFNRRDLAV